MQNCNNQQLIKILSKINKNLSNIAYELKVMNQGNWGGGGFSSTDDDVDTDLEVEPETESDTTTDTTVESFYDVLGTLVTKGTVLSYEGNEYVVMQDTCPSTAYPPNAEGMLAIYQLKCEE